MPSNNILSVWICFTPRYTKASLRHGMNPDTRQFSITSPFPLSFFLFPEMNLRLKGLNSSIKSAECTCVVGWKFFLARSQTRLEKIELSSSSPIPSELAVSQ